MRKIFLKGSLYLVFVLIASVFMTACSKTGTTTESTSNAQVSNAPAASASPDAPKAAPVKIKYMTYRVGTQVSAAAEKKIIAEFNKQFGSEVIVQIEEVPDNIAYIDKLKVLAASNDLPDVIEGKNGINDLTIKGNLVSPLNEYVDADPKWKAEIGDGALNANSRDGKIWSIAAGQLLIGYFYNKEIYTKAGIKPADTWDEFFANLDKIKAAGFDPLSLMSGENAWTSNLLLGSIVGTDGDAGNKFMNTKFPKNFETPEVIKALKLIKTAFEKYTTKDALGAGYANATNNFLQGKTAIIPNGPWMITDLMDATKSSKDFDKKIGVAAYPGNGMFSTYEVGYMLASKDNEHKNAAIKFLKFLTGAFAQQVNLELTSVVPLTNNIQISDEFKQKNPLFAETIKLGLNTKYKYADFDTINYANVTDAWKTLYPELIFNKATAEEFAKKLGVVAAKNK